MASHTKIHVSCNNFSECWCTLMFVLLEMFDFLTDFHNKAEF